MPKTIHSREYTVVLELLRQLRDQAGLRQADVAEQLGVPQSFVSKYEAGERRLDIIELRRLCGVLGTDLPHFVRRLEKAL
jgi:transcriptional regulator with XRE-family HTH domain